MLCFTDLEKTVYEFMWEQEGAQNSKEHNTAGGVNI